MRKTTLIYLLGFLLLIPRLGWSSEGFFPQAKLSSAAARDSFFSFPLKHDCGAARIHAQKEIFISALHCLKDALPPDSSTELGNPLNPESLAHFEDHTGKELRLGTMKFRVLAHGRCWTGYGLDVIADLRREEQELATDCLRGDWVIFQLLNESSKRTCIKAAFDFKRGDEVLALGGPRVKVVREIGLTQLDGRVYSSGQVYSLVDLLQSPAYPSSLVPVWEKIRPVFLKRNADFLLTDVDIINGMSGGPVIARDSLIGISTVGLLPNYIQNHPEIVPMSDGYNFGIHGGLSLKLLRSMHPQILPYFDCP